MAESLRRSIETGTLDAHAEQIVQQRFCGKRPANLDEQRFSEGQKMLTAVRAVFYRMDAESKGGTEHVETNSQILSFAEATAELSSTLNLNAARDTAVEQQERWGLVQALIDRGVVRDRNAYRALFDQAKFTEAGLRAVREKIAQGEPQLAVFNPGGLTLLQAFEILFIKAGIPYWKDTYALNNLGAVKHLRPDQIKGLDNLHNASRNAQLAAFAAAYKKAAPLGVGQPTVLFTPDKKEVSATRKSATQHMQAGTQAMDPLTDFIRWRAQVDVALQGGDLKAAFANRTIDANLPDRVNIIQYPSFVLPNGGVLAFSWNSDRRGVCLYGYGPAYTYGIFGPRLALR